MPSRPPPHTPAAPLVVSDRGGVAESEHRGHLVVTGPDGSLMLSAGDPGAVVYARSALKPLQLAGLLDAGLWPQEPAEDGEDGRVDGRDRPDSAERQRALALAAASHSGQDEHQDGVRAVLAAAGLDEEALRNTPDQPLHAPSAAARLVAGQGPTSLAQNCSGKHAAMLAACVATGWGTAAYLDADHPAQRAALAGVDARAPVVRDAAGVPVTSVDGCGTVLPLVALDDLARAYGALAAGRLRGGRGAGGGATTGRDGDDRDDADAGERDRSGERVAAAMRAHPHLVGGSGRESTAVMAGTAGSLDAVAKDGAEGVFAIGLPDGRGAAWKITDGGARAHRPLAAAVLARLGAPPAVLAAMAPDVGDQPVLGHGEEVGVLAVVAGLLG